MHVANFSTTPIKRLTKFLCEYYSFKECKLLPKITYKFGRYTTSLSTNLIIDYYLTPKTLEEARRRHAGHNFHQVIIDNYTSNNKIHRYLKFRERPTCESKRYERSNEERT